MNFSDLSPRSTLGRMARLPLKLIPRTATMPILQGPLRGCKWLVESGNHGCWLGSYDFHNARRFAEAVKPGDVVFDLGAHSGYYSLIGAVRAGREGRVYAFEPLPSNLRFLRKNLEINGVRNVEVVEKAVVDRPGTVSFDLTHSGLMAHMSETGTHVFESVGLDDLWLSQQVPAPQVIKMNIEGAEVLALEGARRILSEVRPVVFVSTHWDTATPCRAILESSGYAVTPIGGTRGDSKLLATPS